MPIPKRVARFNRIATNRVALPVAGRVPGWAIIEHVGRRSGRRYRTPVSAFRSGSALTVALTYGADSDWVKNVLAAGRCGARLRSRTVTLAEPQLVHDGRRRVVPAFVRPALALLGVSDFLRFSVVDDNEAQKDATSGERE
jgi:deazaflavin-dependent oxidoreductase (nitroreductase family)